ncbi:hypothetical protein UCD39_24945 [Nitrospirillum sp. BR 11752]|uniref:intermembrane phospholipid transport protein YdbH family protein n=1 Tax=Nitrospirillum sp. BR 11752 TaxID=3104293 RepID=UPI002EB34C6C|nr:hypothetical protein [Nitrospirillum sp. BR 11752]
MLEPGEGWPACALALNLSRTQNGLKLTVEPAPGAGPQVSGTVAAGGDNTTKADLTVTGLRVRDWPGPVAGHMTGQFVGRGDTARWTISAIVDTPDAHLTLEGARPWVGDQHPVGTAAAPWGVVVKAQGTGTPAAAGWSGSGQLTLTGTADGRALALALSTEGVTAPELPLMASFLSLTATATPRGDGAWTLALVGPAQAGGRLRDGQGTPVSLGWDPGADGHLAVTWRGGLGKERRGHVDVQGAVVGRLGPANAPLVAGGTTDLRAAADWDAGGLSTLEATAASLAAPVLLNARLEGAHLSAGFDRTHRGSPWQVTLDGGRVQGTVLPPLALAVTLSGDPAGTLTLAGQARGLGTPLVLGVSGHWTAADQRGEAAAVLEPLTLSAVPDLTQLLPGAGLAAPISGLGTIAGGARLSWDQGRLAGSGDLRAEGVSLFGPRLSIDGLDGQVTLDGLFPLHSPPAQRLKAKAIGAALAMGDVGVEFQLADGRVLLQGGDLSWAGGHVHLAPDEDGGFSATVSGVDLARALPGWSAAGYTLQGTLGGRLLGRFEGLTPVLTYGGLEAEGPGHIGYSDRSGGRPGSPWS